MSDAPQERDPRVDFGGKGGAHEFAITPVRGARCFNLTRDGWLVGITYRYPWKPGENVAQCLSASGYGYGNVGGTHAVLQPYPDHTVGECNNGNGHGFYGYYNGSNTYRARGSSRVEGMIEGYGKSVVLGSHGFRAEKAEIVALAMPVLPVDLWDGWQTALWRYSGIPIFKTFEDMEAEFPSDTGKSWGNERK